MRIATYVFLDQCIALRIKNPLGCIDLHWRLLILRLIHSGVDLS